MDPDPLRHLRRRLPALANGEPLDEDALAMLAAWGWIVDVVTTLHAAPELELTVTVDYDANVLRAARAAAWGADALDVRGWSSLLEPPFAATWHMHLGLGTPDTHTDRDLSDTDPAWSILRFGVAGDTGPGALADLGPVPHRRHVVDRAGQRDWRWVFVTGDPPHPIETDLLAWPYSGA